MAKHGVIEISATGTPTLKESSGIIGMAADAATSVFAHQKAAVGYTKWLQLGMVGAVFNMVGVHSTTGKFGLGVVGKNYYLGG
mgnify:CR=1 FL=1